MEGNKEIDVKDALYAIFDRLCVIEDFIRQNIWFKISERLPELSKVEPISRVVMVKKGTRIFTARLKFDVLTDTFSWRPIYSDVDVEVTAKDMWKELE